MSLALLSGCAGLEHDTTHTPYAEQPPVQARASGTLNCNDCPARPVELTLYSATRFDPESFRLTLAGADGTSATNADFQPASGSVFRISGGQQYPDQQLLMLVEPINQQVMMLLPMQDQRYRVLRYRGQSVTGSSMLTPVQARSATR
ncbi:hypothetical protein [Kushneria sinocarnis]|nr:hypothetical protein [Kushneria sinocarnis]